MNKRCWSDGEGEFCGDDYGGEIIVVKRLRIANRILVGFLVGLGLRIMVDWRGGPWVSGGGDR